MLEDALKVNIFAQKKMQDFRAKKVGFYTLYVHLEVKQKSYPSLFSRRRGFTPSKSALMTAISRFQVGRALLENLNKKKKSKKTKTPENRTKPVGVT